MAAHRAGHPGQANWKAISCIVAIVIVLYGIVFGYATLKAQAQQNAENIAAYNAASVAALATISASLHSLDIRQQRMEVQQEAISERLAEIRAELKERPN